MIVMATHWHVIHISTVCVIYDCHGYTLILHNKQTFNKISATAPIMCSEPSFCRGLTVGCVKTCIANPMAFCKTSFLFEAAE